MLQEYVFVAKDDTGSRVKNSIKAKSRYEAISELKGQNLTVISVTPLSVPPKIKIGDMRAERVKKRALFIKKVSSQELSAFCRQLSVFHNCWTERLFGAFELSGGNNRG